MLYYLDDIERPYQCDTACPQGLTSIVICVFRVHAVRKPTSLELKAVEEPKVETEGFTSGLQDVWD